MVPWAVICSPDDRSGPWAARGLRARGLDGTRLVTTDELVYSTRLTHEVSAAGVSSSIALGDGACLGPGLRGALNRVTWVPSAHLARASPDDREYAVQELYALLTSVLHGLPGVVANRPDARGLSGPWLRTAEWAVAAGGAGLGCVGYRSTGADELPDHLLRSVIVVGSTVVPASWPAPGPEADPQPIPQEVRRGCLRLAQAQGVLVLGVDFAVLDERWLVCRATPTPDLRRGGDRLLDALAATLQGAPA